MTESLHSVLQSTLDEVATSYAHKWRLIDVDGMIWCAQGCERLALMPSLHCAECLAHHYSRHNTHEPQCLNRAQVSEVHE